MVHEMVHEMVEAVQTLWGTFGENAYITDKVSGQFADMSQILPANYQGKHYQVKGALLIPATPQGQPPIFQAGPSPGRGGAGWTLCQWCVCQSV